MSAGPRFLWSDFGGVLTPPIEQSMGAFCRDHGIDRRALTAAMTAVATRYGVRDPLAPLDTPLVSEGEWLRQISLELGGALPLTTVADVWFDGRQTNTAWVEVLRSLRASGTGVGLLSNMVPAWDAHWRRMVDVTELFDDVVLSFAVGHRKPEAGIYALAAERAGVRPEQCVLVDDLPANCAGAEAAGWKAVHFVDADSAAAAVARLTKGAHSFSGHAH